MLFCGLQSPYSYSIAPRESAQVTDVLPLYSDAPADLFGIRQAALELKLKVTSHQKILQLVKRRGYRARDLGQYLKSKIEVKGVG